VTDKSKILITLNTEPILVKWKVSLPSNFYYVDRVNVVDEEADKLNSKRKERTPKKISDFLHFKTLIFVLCVRSPCSNHKTY
jgi:hypothetical protein